MKTCSKCKEQKTEDCFYKDKRTSDGLYSACLQCHQATKKKSSNHYVNEIRARVKSSPSPQDVGYLMYCGIQSRILSGRKCYAHVKCLLSLQELRDFVKSDWANYKKLYRVWKRFGFDRKHIPSLDRIDSAKHYELGNIQIITLSENVKKADNPYKCHAVETISQPYCYRCGADKKQVCRDSSRLSCSAWGTYYGRHLWTDAKRQPKANDDAFIKTTPNHDNSQHNHRGD